MGANVEGFGYGRERLFFQALIMPPKLSVYPLLAECRLAHSYLMQRLCYIYALVIFVGQIFDRESFKIQGNIYAIINDRVRQS